jgi:hypothetical protein
VFARTTLAAVLFAALAWAQDPPTAASVTEPGRSLIRPLDLVLGGSGTAAVERTLLIVLDPSPELVKAGFADLFAQAIQRHAKSLASARIGVGVVGQKGCVVLPPSEDFAKVVTEIRARLEKPAAEFQNVYADLRTAASAFANAPGERSILLVSLENGDVEDDVEQTAQALAKAKVKVHALTSEATLADTYWAARPNQDKPRGTTLTGGDQAVIDVPWGFVFQIGSANESTPSAFAMWGLSRIAAATGGRVFLYSAPSQTKHQCGVFSECLFCNGDHLPPDSDWSEGLVSQLGPLATSRADTLSALGRDPWFRAMLTAWTEAAEQGLSAHQPAVKLSGTSATVERQRPGRSLDLFSAANFDRQAKRAEEAASKAEAIGKALQARLEALAGTKGLLRTEAAAHYLRVLMQLSRINLLTYASWCRDIAPLQFGKDAPSVLPPEVPIFDPERRPEGIGYSTMCLCHGVRPFLDVELPGGAALKPELELLDSLYTSFQQKYGRSQFGYLMRRNGIARFWVTYPGVVGKLPRNRPKSTSDAPTTTTPSRPQRAAPGGSGGSSGPTTGGG